MHPLRRASRLLKAAGSAIGMRFAGAWNTGWSVLLRSRFDYKSAVGSGFENSAVMACILWQIRTFPEAPIRISRRQADGTYQPIHDHPMHELIDAPNPYYSGEELWMATLADFTSTGNAYWRKIRGRRDQVAELWWIPQTMIQPRWPSDGSAFLTHYEYNPGGVPEKIEPADIIHFKFGIDPNNVRLGLSPIASVLREVFADDEAANFSGSLLRNLGIPGAIISPKGDNRLQEGDAQAIKSDFKQKFTADGRGDVMVMDGAVDFNMVSFSPQQMDVKTLRRLPEERISAVLGIPAGVVGLGAGLDRNTFSNVEEGRKAAYESNLIPTQRLLAAKLRTALLSEFGDIAGLKVEFDVTSVRALQESQDALWKRADIGIKGGWLTVGAGMRLVGQDAGEEFDYYLRPLMVEAVPLDQAGAPREPISRTANPDPNAAVATPTEVVDSPPTLRAVAGRRVPLQLKAGDDHARRVARLAGPVERTLVSFFIEQEAAVLSAWERRKALVLAGTNGNGRHPETKANDVRDLIGSDWDDRIKALMLKHYHAIAEDAVSRAADELSIDGLYDLALPRIQQMADRLARKVTAVNDTTRDDLRRTITKGSDAGYTIEQIARGVPADGYGGIKGVMAEAKDSRARMIARTETATALNDSTVQAYHASGVVSHVLVVDGDDDEPCAEANGATWTLEHAASNPIAHPHCTRGFSPVIGRSDA